MIMICEFIRQKMVKHVLKIDFSFDVPAEAEIANTTKFTTALTTLDIITIFLIKICGGFRRRRGPIGVDISSLTFRQCPVVLLLRILKNLRWEKVLNSVFPSV